MRGKGVTCVESLYRSWERYLTTLCFSFRVMDPVNFDKEREKTVKMRKVVPTNWR